MYSDELNGRERQTATACKSVARQNWRRPISERPSKARGEFNKALALAAQLKPDLALVDVHLSDGPTGIDVARAIAEDVGATALFMTANVRRLPPDYAGACGVIGKPYSDNAVRTALVYLAACMRTGRAPGLPPVGLQLAPSFAERWGLDDTARAG